MVKTFENKMLELPYPLQIRYIKLHFTVEFVEDTILPKNKVSALRGGIGEMLLRVNCVRNRNCDICDFFSECVVQRTMYSQYEIKPEFVTTGDSIGYVYECNNYQEVFLKGDRLEFNLLLLGKTIVYFNQYMQAVYILGQQGIGKNYSRFNVVNVKNSKMQPILSNGTLDMSRYEIMTVEDYVKYRMKQIQESGQHNKLIFDTPLTLKYQGEFLNQFQMEAIMTSVQRRIYMLDCFEGIENDWYKTRMQLPDILKQECKSQGVKRYSYRKNEKMILRGIMGFLETEHMEKRLLSLLLAGELLHIGKNTSFGFGHYRVL